MSSFNCILHNYATIYTAQKGAILNKTSSLKGKERAFTVVILTEVSSGASLVKQWLLVCWQFKLEGKRILLKEAR